MERRVSARDARRPLDAATAREGDRVLATFLGGGPFEGSRWRDGVRFAAAEPRAEKRWAALKAGALALARWTGDDHVRFLSVFSFAFD